MDLKTFAAYHIPALAQNEARHNLMLAFVPAALANPESKLRFWSLGNAGVCATQAPNYPVILGDLNQEECQAFAKDLQDVDYLGVVGPDKTATWFKNQAAKLGKIFEDPIPQRIHEIKESPHYPGCEGSARLVEADDASLYADWVTSFESEVNPHGCAPDREKLEKMVESKPLWFWIVDDKPVSLVGINRQAGGYACIGPVYTPPELRGRGYAGSVTATVVEHAMSKGKKTVCLYTDLRNPYSNRCYQKIGFKPVCDSMHYRLVKTIS